MNNKEAINIISQMIKDEEGFLSDNTVKAHKMAIRALEQQSCGDAISRQAVLDKIRTEIEQAADKQFQIAMGVADLNERYTHIQMENAYRHSLSIIDKHKESEE